MRFGVSAVGSLALFVGAAFAQHPDFSSREEPKQTPNEPGQERSVKEWELRIAPIYVWARINTTMASEGTGSPPVDVTAGETVLNSAFALRVEFQDGPWLVAAQELFASFSYDTTDASEIHRALDFEMSLLELFGGREMGDDLAIVAGLRHYSGKLSFTASDTAPLEQDDSLLDPAVGVWYRPRLSKSWTLALSVDVGAFGSGFDLSSCGTAVLTWRASKHVGLDVAVVTASDTSTNSGRVVDLDKILTPFSVLVTVG